MKIAIQYFGHLRTWEKCYESTFRNLHAQFDCDVFVHTWSTLNHSDLTWHSNPSSISAQDIGMQQKLDLMSGILKPKMMEVNDQDFLDDSRMLDRFSARGIRYALFSLSRVNRLRLAYQKNTATIYDYVVTLRPDVSILEPLKLEEYESFFNHDPETMIHFVSNIEIIKSKRLRLVVPLASDIFFFSKPSLMDRFVDIYDHFESKYFSFYNSLPSKFRFSPEIGFIEYVRTKRGISRYFQMAYAIRRFDSGLDINIYTEGSQIQSKKRVFLLKLAGHFPHVNSFILRNLQRLSSVLVEAATKDKT